jgi:hypothetical protein
MLKRIWGHGVALLVAAGLAASACADNDGSVFVVGVIAPPIPANGVCTYTIAPTGPFLSAGTVDLGFTNSYTPTVLLGNQLVARGNAQESRVETNRIQLQGSVVRITDAAGAELRSYTVAAAGILDPASGTTPGYGSTTTVLVDPDTAQTLRSQLTPGTTRTLLTYTKFFGQTLGGTHIESGEYQYPITVCVGCLVSFASGTDTAKPRPNCDAPIGSSGSTVTTPCILGQDQFLDCRLCQGNPLCTP